MSDGGNSLEATVKLKIAELLTKLDLNKDGALSVDEHLRGVNDWFKEQPPSEELEALKSEFVKSVCGDAGLTIMGQSSLLEEIFEMGNRIVQPSLHSGELSNMAVNSLKKVLPAIQKIAKAALPNGVEDLTAVHVCNSELLTPTSADNKKHEEHIER